MLVEKQNEEMVADLAPAPPPSAPTSTAPPVRPKIDRAALLAALRAVPDTSSSGGSSPVQYDSGGHDGLTDRSTDSADGDEVVPDK